MTFIKGMCMPILRTLLKYYSCSTARQPLSLGRLDRNPASGASLGAHEAWALPSPPSAKLHMGTRQVTVIGISKLEGGQESDGDGWSRVEWGGVETKHSLTVASTGAH